MLGRLEYQRVDNRTQGDVAGRRGQVLVTDRRRRLSRGRHFLGGARALELERHQRRAVPALCCRTHSNRHIAAAAAALSDSKLPGMGIVTRRLAARRNSSVKPVPSLPTATAIGPRKSVVYSDSPPAATAATVVPR